MSDGAVWALYVRVSTDAQREEGYSIEAQREILEAYCVSKRIKSYDFYVDGGWSGSNVERPEMKRLVSDAKAGRLAGVAVYKLDRLSRSQKDTLWLIEDVFNPSGVAFVSLNENMDTATPIGRAMLGIMSAFAQLERETIRERTRIGMRERVKNGYWPGGGKIPFGYDYDSEAGTLIPNSDAETVRKIYSLYLGGRSFMRIARAVGLKYERMAEQIMLRKTNIGVIVYNGVEYEGRHEPIVPREIYEAAISMYEKRKTGAHGASKHLLAGLVVCGVCGSKMRYQKWGKRGYKIYCYSRDSAKRHISPSGKCSNGMVWADELEAIVITDLFDAADKCAAQSGEDGENILPTLERRREQLKKRLKSLYNLYADSEDESLRETIEENRAALAKAEAEIDAESRHAGESCEKIKTAAEITALRDAWDYLGIDEKRAVIRRAVEKIVVTNDKTDIYYTM